MHIMHEIVDIQYNAARMNDIITEKTKNGFAKTRISVKDGKMHLNILIFCKNMIELGEIKSKNTKICQEFEFFSNFTIPKE